ncbi:AEC family transporter [Ancylobacter sp. 6x-1]|uniref:AEC family transporter n=1 Tax=Ancylobacter crimeensis TaxID=2579147 RepID=A0ABT0DDM7_9HYPH|nr:AEC family transporter [Ancylobacter crimeensis]MCK0198070.1 AEC family transporter [Ancylobacter crimeensis]
MLSQLAAIATIVAPVFGLVGLGYVTSRTGHLTERAADGLSEYVFGLAVPVLIFKTLAEARLPEAGQPWGYWIAYFTGAFIAFGLGMMAARRLFGRSHTEAVVHGFASGQANTVFVGVPLILQAFGPEGAVPLFLLIAVHLPIMMVVATIATEGAKTGLSGPGLAKLARTLALNPILLGIYAGGIAKLAGYVPGGVLKQTLDMLAASAVPCALISLGLALHRYPIQGDFKPAVVITALKLILHPLIVYILVHLLPMPPVWADVAVAFAAMPCGVNAYLLAQRYKAGVAASASAVSLSTGLSLITVTVWFLILGVR